MAPVAEEVRLVRVFGEAFGEDGDGVPVAPEVGGASPEPDDVVEVVGVGLIGGAGLGEVGFEGGLPLGRALGEIQRRAEERDGFRRDGGRSLGRCLGGFVRAGRTGSEANGEGEGSEEAWGHRRGAGRERGVSPMLRHER